MRKTALRLSRGQSEASRRDAARAELMGRLERERVSSVAEAARVFSPARARGGGSPTGAPARGLLGAAERVRALSGGASGADAGPE